MSTDTPTAPATPLREVDLAVTGMTCASCVARVERKLQKLPGVVATVNLPLESAHVVLSAEHDDAALVRAVESAGYGATVTGGRSLREPSDSPDPGSTSEPDPAPPVAEPVLRERQRVAVLPPRRMTEGGGPAVTGEDGTAVTGGASTPVTEGVSTPVTGGGGTAVTGGGSGAVTGGAGTAVPDGRRTVGPGGASTAVTGGASGTDAPGGGTPGVIAPGGSTPGATTVGYPSEVQPTHGLPEAVRPKGHRGYAGDIDLHGRDLKRRLVVAAVLTVPVTAISMIMPWHFPGWYWVVGALTLPVAAWAGWPFHKAAFKAARHGASTMDTLVSLGVIAAMVWSFVEVFRGPNRGMHGGHGGMPPIYFEVAAVVVTFLLAGRFAEHRSRRRAGDALRSLLALGAKAAERVTLGADGAPLRRADGAWDTTEVGIEELHVGEVFVVRPGATVATDGVVVDGASAVDTSLVTGEPVPVDVTVGDAVVGGTVNTSGHLLVRATRVGAETTLARIGRLVAQAQTGKAPIARLGDRISAVFVPIVIVLALLTLGAWLVFDGDVDHAFMAAVAVLIIACPCALGLATPTAILVGTGRGAQLGILIKGPEILERTRTIDTVVLDKTGTVTQGRMALERVTPADGVDAGEALRYAGAVEALSEHPIAQAIATAAASHATGATANNAGVATASHGGGVTPIPPTDPTADHAAEATAVGAAAAIHAAGTTTTPATEATASHGDGITPIPPTGLTPAAASGSNATSVILRERSESQDPGLTADLGPATPVAEPVLRERQRVAVLPARRMTEGSSTPDVSEAEGSGTPDVSEAEGSGTSGVGGLEVSGFVATSGGGVEGVVRVAHSGLSPLGLGNARRVVVGRVTWLDAQGIQVSDDVAAAVERAESGGATTVVVAWDGTARAVLELRDPPKPTSAQAVAELRELGLRPVLLTGDGEGAARAAAAAVGIDAADVVARVLPEEKATAVARLQGEGRVVAMVGDGINDAAALATADLGLAMGTGTDVAIEAGDITLVRGDLRAAASAVRLSRRTLRIIKQNLFWAFAYNVAAIPLAAAGVLNPMIAGAAMAASSVLVVGNSLRLRRAS